MNKNFHRTAFKSTHVSRRVWTPSIAIKFDNFLNHSSFGVDWAFNNWDMTSSHVGFSGVATSSCLLRAMNNLNVPLILHTSRRMHRIHSLPPLVVLAQYLAEIVSSMPSWDEDKKVQSLISLRGWRSEEIAGSATATLQSQNAGFTFHSKLLRSRKFYETMDKVWNHSVSTRTPLNSGPPVEHSDSSKISRWNWDWSLRHHFLLRPKG